MKKRPLCLICLCLVLLILLARLTGLPIFGAPPENSEVQECIEQKQTVLVTGTVVDRVEKNRSVQYVLNNSYLHSEKQAIPLHKILMITTKEEVLKAGSRIQVYGKLFLPDEATNPGQFDLRSYYASQRIYYSLFADSIDNLQEKNGFQEKMLCIKEALVHEVDRISGKNTAEILKAMLLGDRTGISDELKRDYQVGGILHILAISGMHITLLGNGFLKLLQKILLPFPVAVGITLPCMVLYCIFTGGAASSVRALLMFTAALGAKLFRRTYDLPCALSLAAFLILLENPGLLFYSGFQLSFCAMLSVTVVWPAVSWLLPKQVKKPEKHHKRTGTGGKEARLLRMRWMQKWIRYYVRLLIHLSLFWFTINISLLPLTAWYYYEVPVWGLVPNLLMIPVVPLLLFFGMAGMLAGYRSSVAGKILLLPADLVMKGFCYMTEGIREMPCSVWVCGQPGIWQVIVSEILLASGVWFLFKKKQEYEGYKGKRNREMALRGRMIKKTIAGVISVLVLLLVRFDPAWSLTMLDVGQGDCLVLREHGSVFLVDGGSSSEKEVGKRKILPYLKSQGIDRVQAVFLTHPDEDHVNGLLEVLEAVKEKQVTLRVKNLYMPFWMKGSKEEEEFLKLAAATETEVHYLTKGDQLRTGQMLLEVLSPDQKGGSRSGNSGSLVLSVCSGGFSALLTGDLESDGERNLLPLKKSYDYLKVAHHGSKYSSSEAFLQQVRPKIAAVSVPKNSRYGHPHRETMDRLVNVGSALFVTRDCGAITINSRRNSWVLKSYKPLKEVTPVL